MFGLSTIRLYAYAGLALVIAGLVSTVLIYRGEAHDAAHREEVATGKLAVAVEANETQKAVIERVTELRRTDDTVVAQLVDKVDKLATVSGDVTDKISKLERGNDEIRNFMGAIVPNDLAGVLNRNAAKGRKPGTGNTRPAVGPNAKMRKPVPRG